VFTEVVLAGAPPLQLCFDPSAGDPIADYLLKYRTIDESVQRAFLGHIRPAARVLDLGCHLGTFSLPAAALGAHVLAVDGWTAHVELLRAAAERNGFDHLEVVNYAITDEEHPVEFTPGGMHGHIRLHEDGRAVWLDVPAVTVDELLDRRGWDHVDVIKMDIEGCETMALAGMERLFARGCRPAIVFECNGGMLPRYGSSVCETRERVAELGYELLFIDHLRPGTLVEASPESVQPECVSDYLAVVSRPENVATRWKLEPPLGRERTLTRLLDSSACDSAGYRCYATQVLVDGPEWLRAAPAARAAIDALADDVDGSVRAAVDPQREPSWAVEHKLAPEPRAEGTEPDIRIYAQGISLCRPRSEPDPPREPAALDPRELLVADVWFHVRARQLVGVVSEDTEAGSALMRALAGHERPAAGALEGAGRRVLLPALGEAMEGSLSIAENIAVLGSFLGCAVSDAERETPRVAELAGVADELGAALDDMPAAIAAQLALTVALELGTPDLLLVDVMPRVLDAGFREWIRNRIAHLRGSGGAVVQVITDADELFGPADRILWIGAGELQASGHARSVFESRWRHRLGLQAASMRGKALVATRTRA
jgi:FkbM family methyltransferase